MRRSLTLSLGLHAALIGAAIWLLGEQPEPPRALAGMLVVHQPRPEPEPMTAPPVESPTRPADPAEPIEAEPVAPPELEPLVVDQPTPVSVWSPPDYARLTRVVRAARKVKKAEAAPKAKPAPVRKRAAAAALVGAKPAKGRCAPVKYPARARRLGIEGLVLLRVRIAVDGSPKTVLVLESSGHGSLDRAARSAVERWRFVPASRGGRAVAQWLRVPIEFRIRNRS